MPRRIPAIPTRPLAALTAVAVLVWTLASVVWAGAGTPNGCPMHAMAAISAEAVVSEVTHGCCEAPIEDAAGTESPCGPKSCCCPAVAPVIPQVALATLPVYQLSYWADFAEPVLVDRLAVAELIIPPVG